jgi:hypothetical protein
VIEDAKQKSKSEKIIPLVKSKDGEKKSTDKRDDVDQSNIHVESDYSSVVNSRRSY